MDELLNHISYSTTITKLQKIVRRLITDTGPTRDATIIFADGSKKSIKYGDEQFKREQVDNLLFLVNRDRTSRGMESICLK